MVSDVSKNGADKRRDPRTKHESVLEIFDQNGNFITGVGRLVNFSNVGICFSSTKVLTKGERIRARVQLVKEGKMEVAARVVWARKKPNTMLYGIEFEKVRSIES